MNVYLARLRKKIPMKKLGTIIALIILTSMTVWASDGFDLKVDTFTTTPAALTACEDIPGTGTTIFDLTSVEGDIVTILPNMAIGWYVDAGLTQPIGNPSAYMSASAVVFAEVFSTVDPLCRTTEEVTLTVLMKPDLSYLASIPDTMCGRFPFQFGDTPGPDAIYRWIPASNLDDDSIANPLFTPDPSIDDYNYGVIATSLDGMCQSSESVSFTIFDPELNIMAEDTIELCKGDAMVTLTATANQDINNIMWTSSRDTLSEFNGPTTAIDAELSTTIVASLTFDNGCTFYDTVFLRVDSIPEFELNIKPGVPECGKYCPGTFVRFTSNAPDLACYPDITYQWTPANGIIDADTTLNVAIILEDGPGWFYTRRSVNHACIEIDTHLVNTVDTTPTVNGLPAKICRGDVFTLTIDTSYLPGFENIEWSTESMDFTLSCEECVTTTVTVNGDATQGGMIQVKGFKDGCCTASNSVPVTITIPPIPIEPLTLCRGVQGQIMADPSFTNYLWVPLGPLVDIDPNNVFNPIVNNVPIGGASFTVTAIDSTGCPSESTFTVRDSAIARPAIEPLTVCQDVGLGTVMADPTFSYIWNELGGGDIDPKTGANPTVGSVGEFGANFNYTATNPDGCIVDGFFNVDVFPGDNMVLTNMDSDTQSQGATIMITLSEPNVPGDDIIWTIQDAIGNVIGNAESGGTTATFFVRPGENMYCAAITNTSGCPQDTCLTFFGIPIDVFIPNAFAPGGTVDDNRRFQPLNAARLPFPAEFIADFQVYSRWGEKVYDNDSNATGWDGRQDGQLAPSDVYIYIMTLRTEDGTAMTFTGDVSLIR
jgi:hypothetical protein